MAIRKEEEKKVGMKVTDNMDGEEKANEKLDMASFKDIKKILLLEKLAREGKFDEIKKLGKMKPFLRPRDKKLLKPKN